MILKIVDEHNAGEFDGIRINENTPPIPILCFADDCIIFSKTNTKSINFIINTLNLFAEEAGLNICWTKSKAFFSKNTPKTTIREICHQLQIKPENHGEK